MQIKYNCPASFYPYTERIAKTAVSNGITCPSNLTVFGNQNKRYLYRQVLKYMQPVKQIGVIC